MGFQIISKVFVRNTFGRNGKANLLLSRHFKITSAGKDALERPICCARGFCETCFSTEPYHKRKVRRYKKEREHNTSAMFPFLCPERDSNPYDRNGQGILSPSCLPIPPSGQPLRCAKIRSFDRMPNFWIDKNLITWGQAYQLRHP